MKEAWCFHEVKLPSVSVFPHKCSQQLGWGLAHPTIPISLSVQPWKVFSAGILPT